MEDEQAVVAAPAKGNNRRMMFLIIGLLVVLIGVIVAVAFFVIGALNNQAAAGGIAEVPFVPIAGVEDLTFVDIGHPINTNLLVGADGRSMAVTVNFTISVNTTLEGGEDLVLLLQGATPVIRSIALSVVRDLTAAEVNSRDGATLLGNEILSRLRQEFQTNLITGIQIVDIFTAAAG